MEKSKMWLAKTRVAMSQMPRHQKLAEWSGTFPTPREIY